jgi:exonuclease III
MLVTENRPANPRKIFYEDLTSFIQRQQEDGAAILLCLDANETWTKRSSAIQKLATQCGLEDIHTNCFPNQELPSHRNGSSKIDYILASPSLIAHVTQAGILSFDDAFCSDH